ncbi:helix-turn-helix domain-containing protein [Streptomyces muensis]|uniref:Helix-turn-helix domain-containing protein n=1 Tax=Streptomyces muensis TaxID=1077944 RepID=A0A9X1TJ16_STRM4|nr:helix-turn-helix domain-containing protein [Streptomyces muensis]MCF1592570.1 helix-turn-helix domain-containing protein [Streptomyces muensis]
MRGAAVFAGCPAGLVHPRHQICIRVDEQGRPARQPRIAEEVNDWPCQPLDDESDGFVWIERSGEAAMHDALLLERLAASAHLTIERAGPLALDDASAVEILLAAASTSDARRKALRRLQLREESQVYVMASDSDDADALSRRSAVVDTLVGPVRASVVVTGDTVARTRWGSGPEVMAVDTAKSWRKALCALRLTSRLQPRLQWGTVSSFGPLVDAIDNSDEPPPDVLLIESADREPWVLDTLEAVAVTDTHRGAAALLGLHHSTVQSRLSHLEEALDLKIDSPTGRTRILMALALHRAKHNRFGVRRLTGSHTTSPVP